MRLVRAQRIDSLPIEHSYHVIVKWPGDPIKTREVFRDRESARRYRLLLAHKHRGENVIVNTFKHMGYIVT